jgi:type 1 glutamine amidotransferase
MKKLILFVILFNLVSSCQKRIEDSGTSMEKPSVEDIQKITSAIPEKPQIAPQKLRRVLIFSLSWGYKHSMIPFGKEMFRIMGEKTGAFETIISDDPAMFEPDNLNQFDAVIFNNTNNEIFLPENFEELSEDEKYKAKIYDTRLKDSFVEFLESGKGLVVLHAGVASFRNWPEFGEIIGARFDNHPWNAGSTVTIKVEEPQHPLVHAFPEDFFQVTDEIYQVKFPYSREKLRVLLSIDTSRTNMTVNNINRTDGDFAMSWIKKYKNGRIFYCAFGHEKHIYWDKSIIQHLLDGIQYVIGDLEADAQPIK